MKGLNRQEIDYRKNNGLINNENIKNSRSLKEIISSNLITLFNIIHLILFILVLTTGHIEQATFLFSIILNIFISIYQEIKAKKIIDKLKIANSTKVTVIREDKEEIIDPSEILLDDILYLKQGDNLIVDTEVVQTDGCEVDESVITGESDSIIKKNKDKIISGSIILSGTAYAKVTSINRDTYANKLIKEASKSGDDSSYLKQCINAILKVVTVLIIPVGIALFITQFKSGESYSESILSSVAGIIGMIPDGLVLLTSVSLTVGVIKMASKKVIVERLSGIELLACIDVLCLDKTGTITDGSMEVVDVVKLSEKENINNIIANMLIDNINVTDIAMNKYFKKEHELVVKEHTPFASIRKYSSVEFEKEGLYALGALEYLTNNKMSDYPELDSYLAQGYRVITLVKCKNEVKKDTNKVLGFVIFKDNIRKNAKETLEYFKSQDVNIKVISGDNPQTVSNLLKQINMDGYDKYISGPELPNEYDKLKEIVNDYTIYGRVTPEQKQLIIRALKEENTVGMIGDGVNDILALKEADCGIALASGISAARSVSEIVLTNSDFGVLPGVVNEGRRVVNNIERVASMYLIKTTYSFLISVLCIFFSHEYPFFPIQLSLISTVCVGIPSFFLALEPNYNKVKKGFLVKVFRNALPSGLCVFINISFLLMMIYLFKLDFDNYRLTVVCVTGYLSLRLLYQVCKPLSKMRKLLLFSCAVCFYALLLIFSNFFSITSFNFWNFIFIPILILGDNYIVEFLENCYDWVVNFIYKLKNKRSKVVSEKV